MNLHYRQLYKAAPKLRSDKRPDKPRRSAPKASAPATPPAPTAAPSPSISPELAALGSTTQQLAESVRLIQAQQQMILDSQRAQEQRQLLLRHDVPAPGPYTAYTIAKSNNTTFNHAPTRTESTTHRT